MRKHSYRRERGKNKHTILLRTAVIHRCVQCGNIPDSSVLAGAQLLREREIQQERKGDWEKGGERGRAARERGTDSEEEERQGKQTDEKGNKEREK